jgi:hypothetical protein
MAPSGQPVGMLLVPAAAGATIFIVVVLVIFLGAVAAVYTRRGSGIDAHPQGAERPEAPGVGEGSSHVSAADDPAHEEGEAPSTHGTG